MPGQKGRSGRHAKSTEQHKKQGTYRKDRHEETASVESKLKCGIPKPKGLSKDASQHWEEIVSDLEQAGIAKKIDRKSLIAMAESWATYRKCYPLHYEDPTDRAIRQATYAALDQWNYYASRFGMTPADRAKIKIVSDEEQENDFEKFMQRGGNLN